MTILPQWAVLVLLIYPTLSTSSSSNYSESFNEGRSPAEAIYGIYEHCVTDASLPCIQKKLITFLDRLSKVKVFSVVGDWVSVVKSNDTSENITETNVNINDVSEGRMESDRAFNQLEKHFEHFLENHFIRLSLPIGIRARISGESREFGTSIDVNVGRFIGEARKKVKLKNMMAMMMSGIMSKAAMLGPILMMIVKIKAMKALVLSTLALLLSKIQLLKMLMKGKGGSKEVIILHESHGGGGGGHGGGGGGGGWSSGGGGWSGGGGGGHDSYGPPSDSGGGYGGSGGHGGSAGGYSGGGGGGWNSGGGGGYGGGGGAWASASGDSYSSADGGHGAGGAGGGWGGGWASRKYDPTWLVYRNNKTATDTKQMKHK